MKTYALSLLVLLATLSTASAKESSSHPKDPLAGQPAVRHRHELREGRFEIGPSFGFAINRSFRHALMIGGKLEYHITDYLSLGAEVAYGINFDTGLTGELESSYDADEFKPLHDRLADLTLAGDVRAVFTPFSGKLGIFKALFLAYDFYVFGGFGMGMTKNNTDDAGTDAANEGFRPGFAWGVGVHLFANRFVSIGLELKDIVFSDNESGQDITRGLSATEQEQGGIPSGSVPEAGVAADGDDNSFLNHFFATLNVTFFLPPSIKISD